MLTSPNASCASTGPLIDTASIPASARQAETPARTLTERSACVRSRMAFPRNSAKTGAGIELRRRLVTASNAKGGGDAVAIDEMQEPWPVDPARTGFEGDEGRTVTIGGRTRRGSNQQREFRIVEGVCSHG